MFVISNGDNVKYEDNPAIAQAKANLAAVEQIQQERAKQRRLEREEWKVQAEVERLRREIKEVEREQKELEEMKVERLTREKEKLEENRAEQRRAAALCGSERAVEQRQAVLEPVKTLVLRYNTSVVNCVVKLRLVSVSNFYCNAGPKSCNNYSS